MPSNHVATIRRSMGLDDGSPISGQRIEAGSSGITIKTAFGALTSDEAFAISFDVADVQAVILKSNVDLTIKTNDDTTPGDTIPLKAGSVLDWSKSDGYYDCPFSVDVTEWFVSCASAAQLTGIILLS